MSIDIDTIEPRRCPICDAGVLSKLDSPTGLSHFIKFVCGFEMCDQYEARPRGWKPRLGSTCRNIDANSLWALRRAVEQSAEDFNAEAVARLKAESEVRELRAALGRLQGEVETIINTEPHEDVCLIGRGGDCTCWQARLERALDGDK